MNAARAWVLGVLEFRISWTRNCGRRQVSYDRGREFAHWVTLRRFET